MRISDWSSDVCSSDLPHGLDQQPQLHRLAGRARAGHRRGRLGRGALDVAPPLSFPLKPHATGARSARLEAVLGQGDRRVVDADASPERVDAVAQDDLSARIGVRPGRYRSEEHTSELQSLMRISYAVFCLKKKKTTATA